MKKIFSSVVMAWLFLFMLSGTTLAASSVIYNALPDVLPPNAPSQPFQAQQTFEFGDYVHLSGTDRDLTKITVAMSDWAVYADYATDARYMGNSVTWTHPITLSIYGNHLDANGVPDTLIGTKTQDMVIPWRPAADPTCATVTAWRATDGTCYNGFAFNAEFDLTGMGITAPDDVIVSLKYNTQTYGANPIGIAGPYNSLNVLVPENQPVSTGSDDSNDKVFWNTVTAGWYADLGASGVGTFREDTNWSPYGTVAMKIEAQPTAVVPPVSADQCKQGGWKVYNNPAYKNQGDCVSWLQSNVHAQGNRKNN